MDGSLSSRERLVQHVQNLECLVAAKQRAAETLKEAFDAAQVQGFDTKTLKVVLKLRTMTPAQRRERRALESIYMAALGMLDGEGLPDEARRRLDGQPPTPDPATPADPAAATAAPDHAIDAVGAPPASPAPEQPVLPIKTADEARQEGMDAATAGKRVYDNPYPAGDPCRAAWDEGWCAQSGSHGMEPPAAYARRTAPPPKKDDPKSDDDQKGDDEPKGDA